MEYENDQLEHEIESAIEDLQALLLPLGDNTGDSTFLQQYAQDGVVEVDTMTFSFNPRFVLLYVHGGTVEGTETGAVYEIKADEPVINLLEYYDEKKDAVERKPLASDVATIYFVQHTITAVTSWLAERSGKSEDEILGW